MIFVPSLWLFGDPRWPRKGEYQKIDAFESRVLTYLRRPGMKIKVDKIGWRLGVISIHP
jgi:hypothetical protein